jgi:chemotaxis protein MotB
MKDATIIKTVKKKGHGDAHGGAWKVAYADFVTAMMAFFLLLWLLNATSKEQKEAIADYFLPSASRENPRSGSNGLLGGATPNTPGARKTILVSSPEFSPTGVLRQLSDGTDGDQGVGARGGMTPDNAEKDAEKTLAEADAQRLEKAEKQLKQAIQDVPDLKDLQRNIIIEPTPEGLRIQIVDQEGGPMFPSGSTEMTPKVQKLLELVSRVARDLPNKIAITGHTDAVPFQTGGAYSNWELSIDRANSARRRMLAAGVSPTQIETVVGKADQAPAFPDKLDPRNRRIAIVLVREPPAVKETSAQEPAVK